MAIAYWCPPYEDSSALRLGAIKTVVGQRLDLNMYQSILGNRVQEMVDAEPSPKEAVSHLMEGLRRAGMDLPSPDEPDEAGSVLIWSNPMLPDYLRLLGLFPEFPVTVDGSNWDAAIVYRETTLDEWIALLILDDHLR